MSYSQYKTVDQVQQQFGITYRDSTFVEPRDVTPPAHFLNDLAFTMEHIDVYASEAARSELIISTILLQTYKNYYKQYAFWVQRPLVYDDTLNGVPDYLISARSPLGKKVFKPPFIVVIEAKRNDFELGWGQCLAELVAAQKLNGDVELPIYGIVTDGEFWNFGKLTNDTFVKEQISYTTSDTAELFGALDYILYTAGKHLSG